MKVSNGTFIHLEEQLCRIDLKSIRKYRSSGPDKSRRREGWTEERMHLRTATMSRSQQAGSTKKKTSECKLGLFFFPPGTIGVS